MRAAGAPIAMLTAYDYPTAALLAEAGVHALLVGDSAAMAVLGAESTVHATMDFLVTITGAVRRGAPNVFVLADMPFGSYPDAATAVANALRFMQEARADAVKVEVDGRHAAIVQAMAMAGVPVCAHLGLLPQRVGQLGGYKAQGRTTDEASRITQEAAQLRLAGAEMILLEAVPNEVSAAVHAAVDCPVIGCGAGSACDGHVVVIHDVLGFNPRPPRFVDVLADVPGVIRGAAAAYVKAVGDRAYPAERHGYRMKTDRG